jgi:hypothetical protein
LKESNNPVQAAKYKNQILPGGWRMYYGGEITSSSKASLGTGRKHTNMEHRVA